MNERIKEYIEYQINRAKEERDALIGKMEAYYDILKIIKAEETKLEKPV